MFAVFIGLFRRIWVSELVSDSRNRVDGLLASDVRVSGSQLVCRIHNSEMEQCGVGVTVNLHSLVGSMMCPVRCFHSYVAIRPSGPLPLFVHENGSFLSRYTFVQLFLKN